MSPALFDPPSQAVRDYFHVYAAPLATVVDCRRCGWTLLTPARRLQGDDLTAMERHLCEKHGLASTTLAPLSVHP